MEIDHTAVANFLAKVGMFGVTDFERNWRPEPWLKFTEDHYEIPIIAIVVYLSFCFGVRRLMEGHSPYSFRMPLAIWNMMLSVFSFCGMFRTVGVTRLEVDVLLSKIGKNLIKIPFTILFSIYNLCRYLYCCQEYFQ
jgi:hypothetical protein